MKYFNGFSRLFKTFANNPKDFMNALNTVAATRSGVQYSHEYSEILTGKSSENDPNPLRDYFENHKEGPGIFKWEHYFEIYHRHLEKFVNKKVNIVEIGIYSGGSLEMWHSYFGKDSHIYGIDIEKDCLIYESEFTNVFIGDQADRNFWKEFKSKVKDIDIIIDDGGHTPEQQQITLEELLPVLNPGGVFICEDIHEEYNRFAAYTSGLIHELNQVEHIQGKDLQSRVSNFQAAIHSLHFYPYITVIEKNLTPLKRLICRRQGTQWQPFL